MLLPFPTRLTQHRWFGSNVRQSENGELFPGVTDHMLIPVQCEPITKNGEVCASLSRARGGGGAGGGYVFPALMAFDFSIAPLVVR